MKPSAVRSQRSSARARAHIRRSAANGGGSSTWVSWSTLEKNLHSPTSATSACTRFGRTWNLFVSLLPKREMRTPVPALSLCTGCHPLCTSAAQVRISEKLLFLKGRHRMHRLHRRNKKRRLKMPFLIRDLYLRVAYE